MIKTIISLWLLMVSIVVFVIIFMAKIAEAEDIKVMVIDTGISHHHMLEKYVQYESSKDYADTNGHGTHVAGIVAYGNHNLNDPLCDKVKIYACNYFLGSQYPDGNVAGTIKCINKAIEMKMDYVNYSASGNIKDLDEYFAFKRFSDQGGISVVAAGNDGDNLQVNQYFPASYHFGFKNKLGSKYVEFKPINTMIVVQNKCLNGFLCKTSNYHPQAVSEVGEMVISTYIIPKNGFAIMTGTSQSSPAYLHNILKQRCKNLK